jgi:hypothetical protein
MSRPAVQFLMSEEIDTMVLMLCSDWASNIPNSLDSCWASKSWNEKGEQEFTDFHVDGFVWESLEEME